jgi:hypothetical protein
VARAESKIFFARMSAIEAPLAGGEMELNLQAVLKVYVVNGGTLRLVD